MEEKEGLTIKIIPIVKYEFTEEEIEFAKKYYELDGISKEISSNLEFSLEDELLNF